MKLQCLEEESIWRVIARQTDYLRRLLGTAIGFCLFGLGGVILCVTLFPGIALFSRDARQKQKHVRGVIRHTFRIFLEILKFLGVLEVRTSNLELIQDTRGVLIICNHPSLLDVVVIMSRLKNVQCVVKHKLWTNPVIGGVVRAAGYLRNDLAPDKFLEQCKAQLDSGENIIIFPEGTRSTPGQPIKLRRGLGNLAIATKATVQSLILECDPINFIKGQKWYSIPARRIIFHLRAGDLFSHANYQADGPRSLQVRALTRDIQKYYNRNLGYE